MQFSKITLSLLLALPTAFAYSLGDKESLNKNEVTLGCLNTYSREVTECSDEEISSGSCSSDCKAALDTLAKDVMLACRQAYAGPDTLLRKILDGGLTITLCKTISDNKDDEEEKKQTEEPEPEETTETEETSNTTELVIDNSPTTTITTPEETSSAVTETVTSDVEEPTGSTNTNTTESTGGSDTETSTETSTDTESATTTETGNPDETILGDDDNAAGKVGTGMGMIIGAAIVGLVSML